MQHEQILLQAQLTEALKRTLPLLNHYDEDHMVALTEGWAALSKAEQLPLESYYSERALEAMPSLLESIGVNEWEWACSFDLPTGYATRVAITQKTREDALWWTLALESPEGEHGSLTFTVGTVEGADVTRVMRIVETALCYEGYDVFEGTEDEWQTYLKAMGVSHVK